jgi:hypothetical protein
MKRILVTGSRNWRVREAVSKALTIYSTGRDTMLVHGACPTGADKLADEIASEWGWPIERHPADWSGPCRPECRPGHRKRNPQRGSGSYCPMAGFYRNQEMVDLGADVVLAFPLGESRGTLDCMARARRAGLLVIPVSVVES